MNILFTRFPLESRYGGAEVQVLSLMEGLVANGHDVGFLGSCPVLGDRGLGVGDGANLVDVQKLDIGPPPVSKWHAVSFVWRQFAMKKKLQQALLSPTPHPPSPDTVIMLSLSEKILLTPYLIKHGVKVIWLEHDRVGPWLSKNPWLPNLKKLSSHATTVVVSELSRKLYLDLGFDPEHVVAIPNGIDPERIKSKTQVTNDKQNTNSKSQINIGCISRLTHDKGLDVLIEAVSDLSNVKLTIIGTGRNENTIKIQADKANNVQITDHIDDLGEFYHSLDLFVLPSRLHDPFGLVAAEAMLCSVPVIVTDVCGIADYLENGTDAIVVPAGESKGLKEAIESFDPNMGIRGKETAENLFAVEKMVEKYEELLTKM